MLITVRQTITYYIITHTLHHTYLTSYIIVFLLLIGTLLIMLIMNVCPSVFAVLLQGQLTLNNDYTYTL